ncbi:putative protein kinase domain-containing protein [Phaeomoniella chlamydospora]|uniref:Protein kinase domain-containing protein n=1 Tax=Phaeomoniella chlamydospora TaxID=158046 RepID=A0A0G2F0T9_PHACM|nr:putative protein kinase domain-containing protein [Phaeomoniella chlamydospora]
MFGKLKKCSESRKQTTDPTSGEHDSVPNLLSAQAPEETTSIPETIKCEVIIDVLAPNLEETRDDALKSLFYKTSLGKPDQCRRNLFSYKFFSEINDLRWAATDTFRQIEGKATSQLAPLKDGLVHRNGVMQWNYEIPLHIARFATALCQRQGQPVQESFYLRVYWEYSRYQFGSIKESSLTDLLYGTFNNYMQRNWRDEYYIPSADIESILSLDVIERVVQTEKHLKDLNEEHAAGKIKVYHSRMFALCIHTRKLECFRPLFDAGITDFSLELEEIPMIPGTKGGDIDDLNRSKIMFFAYQFSDELSAKSLPRQTVVPIHTKDLDDQIYGRELISGEEGEHIKAHRRTPTTKTASDKEPGYLGKGSQGKVTKISIEQNHHKFSGGTTKVFAVKKFFEPTVFEQEVKMLEQLAEHPHPHIHVHLAAFMYKGSEDSYVLFPYAKTNLQALMEQYTKPASHTAKPVEWLLSQVAGLAGALAQIHDLRMGPDRTEGIHHDIKPANVLLFTTQPGPMRWDDCQLKLADFGCGKLQKLIAREGRDTIYTYTPRGTITYHGPETLRQDEGTARFGKEFDVWALSCVFLEILDWFFLSGGVETKSFSEERVDDDQTQPSRTDQFWYKREENPSAKLKPSVVKKINSLRGSCFGGKPAFLNVIEVVQRCLEISPKARMHAAELAINLLSSCSKARRDLSLDPDCYAIPDAFDENQCLKPERRQRRNALVLHEVEGTWE